METKIIFVKKPCRNCKGDCCVNKRGSIVEHGSVIALHSCPDCSDGTEKTENAAEVK